MNRLVFINEQFFSSSLFRIKNINKATKESQKTRFDNIYRYDINNPLKNTATLEAIPMAVTEPYEVVLWKSDPAFAEEGPSAKYRALSSEQFSSQRNAEWFAFMNIYLNTDTSAPSGASISKDNEVFWTLGLTPFPAL